jgi:myo-inositol-1(or 4)-monophosphatase
MTSTARELRDLALFAARAGAAVALDMHRDLSSLTFTEKATGKNQGADLVSAADIAVENVLRRTILAARPNDSLLGEEGSSVLGESGLEWVLDPIDGTLNYAYGRTGFSVSVAVRDESGVLAGVVIDVMSGREYASSRGGGALRDGVSVATRAAGSLGDLLVDLGSGRGEVRSLFHAVVQNLQPRVRDVRRVGSAALALAMVGAGELDAVYGPNLEIWDRAAGALIAAEGGAQVGNLAGGPADDFMTLAAHPSVFDEFAAVVRDVLRGVAR